METFVLRIWVPAVADDMSAAGLHGVIEHVASGRKRRFIGSTELISFIEHVRTSSTPAHPQSRERNH